MEETDRPVSARIIEDLTEHALEYDFFHALRRIRQAFPSDPVLGTAIRPGQESVRLNQTVTLNFPPSSYEKSEYDEENKKLTMWTYAFGLTGANGPLPSALNEFIMNRSRHDKDTTLEAFLNIFHHRFISLFYRAWALNNPVVDFESGENSRFFRHVRSLVGLGTEGISHRDAVDDHSKVYFSGHLGGSVRNQEGLESILEAYFEMPSRIEPFQGQWLVLPEEARVKLGMSESTGLLGQNLIVGSMVCDGQIRFRIVFGPLEMDDYKRLLPGETAFRRLADWVKLYTGLTYEWEVQLILKKEEIHPIQLGQESYLGWTTWTISNPVGEDRGDLILNGN